jgi:GT2 family glycosyltransferase
MSERITPPSLIRRLLADDPDHLEANRAALEAFCGPERQEAARTLAEIETEPARRIAALRALDLSAAAPGGAPAAGIAMLRPARDAITGDLVWSGPADLILTLEWEAGSATARVEADPAHSLKGAFGHALRLSIPWPAGARAVTLTISPDLMRIGPPLVRPLTPREAVPEPSEGAAPPFSDGPRGVAVIVPVYLDREATRACFDALLTQDQGIQPMRVIAVDDASPSVFIRDDLEALARAGRIELRSNRINLGFVGAVNGALATLKPHEDALLLNADAILPPGAIGRLAHAAWQAADTATITPLSNNGELTSVPEPFRVNPLLSLPEITALDAAATAAFAGRSIELPNGIGFCLYVRRDALARLGGLDGSLERGYLEDVEFCLRARDAGLKNLCATDVYVGHAGTRSFRSAKRRLVLRNLRRIEARWPRLGAETDAFIDADPLREVIDKLEQSAPWPAFRTLVVARLRVFSHRVEPRIEALGLAGPVLLALLPEEPGDRIVLRARDGGFPNSFSVPDQDVEAWRQVQSRLASAGLGRVLIADPAALSPGLAALLATGSAEIAVDLTDAPACAGLAALCDAGRAPRRITAASAELGNLSMACTGIAATVVPTPAPPQEPAGAIPARPRDAIGLVAPEPSAAAQALVRALTESIANAGPRRRVVILGPAPPGWVDRPNAYASGIFSAGDLAALAAFHAIAAFALVAPDREAGAPAFAAAEQTGLACMRASDLIDLDAILSLLPPG